MQRGCGADHAPLPGDRQEASLPSTPMRVTAEETQNQVEAAADSVRVFLLGSPLRIAIIVLISVALVVTLRFVVARVVRRLSRIPARRIGVSESAKITVGTTERMGQRLHTFQSVLNSTIAVVVGAVAVLMILAELGMNVAPLLTSAGVLGVALAFGAQSLVRDMLSGVFMLVEDQYGVGDRVELAAAGALATGTVEQVALRVTTVRDDDGRLWHVRNGEILRVANESQGWAQAVAEVQVAAGTDVTDARDAMTAVTAALREDPAYADAILAESEVRVENLSATGITLRWSVRTAPGQQWRVASGMRRRLAPAFTERGIELAS